MLCAMGHWIAREAAASGVSEDAQCVPTFDGRLGNREGEVP